MSMSKRNINRDYGSLTLECKMKIIGGELKVNWLYKYIKLFRNGQICLINLDAVFYT
ncbi:hypothetical protein EZS27_027110 [termite gut metagenome]|uniref:Uncharacterized protein n=1 Tax=termite gut metagenome TaxID=433724 RepID=A0A5J4QNC9_9ZZZZ